MDTMKIVLAITDRLTVWKVHAARNYTLELQACYLGVKNKFSL